TEGFLPHEWNAVDVLLESASVGLTLDTGHDFCTAGKDLSGVMKRRDRLHHMHLHDAKGTHPHLALGDGELDIPARLTLAKDTRSTVVLEIKNVDALRRSVNWLKR
ncbi:MAG: sugar phosphate isomerase/epimerase, partial [Clostridia bacterium]|nr:sugar phosphate isomerase/epimerase [Clostridia bacterium]